MRESAQGFSQIPGPNKQVLDVEKETFRLKGASGERAESNDGGVKFPQVGSEGS